MEVVVLRCKARAEVIGRRVGWGRNNEGQVACWDGACCAPGRGSCFSYHSCLGQKVSRTFHHRYHLALLGRVCLRADRQLCIGRVWGMGGAFVGNLRCNLSRGSLSWLLAQDRDESRILQWMT